MDLFIPVMPIISAGRRRCLWKRERKAEGISLQLSRLGEGNTSVMGDTGVLGLNPQEPTPRPRELPMEAKPLSPEFSELFIKSLPSRGHLEGDLSGLCTLIFKRSVRGKGPYGKRRVPRRRGDN